MRTSEALIPRRPSRTRKILLTAGCLALVAVIGVVEEWSGGKLRGGVLYLAPVALAAWFAGKWEGMVVATACTGAWVMSNLALRSEDFWVIVLWNLPSRGVVYFGAAWVFARLREALLQEHEIARKDFPTGAANAVFFYEILELEHERTQRHGRPFTLAYMDLDNFKAMNDRFGHSVGDKCLRAVAKVMAENLRGGDIAARIGGDEFAILLPETDEVTARGVIGRLRNQLLAEMRKRNWPVTFSIGVVTYRRFPLTVDEVIRKADAVMYSVKDSGKNNVRHAIFTTPDEWGYRTTA